MSMEQHGLVANVLTHISLLVQWLREVSIQIVLGLPRYLFVSPMILAWMLLLVVLIASSVLIGTI